MAVETMMTEIKQSIEKCVKKCLNEDDNYQVDFENALSNLGLNSISVIKLLVLLESELDIEFDESKFNFSDYNSLNSIAEYISTMKK